MRHDELVDAINHQIVIAPPFALGGYTKFLQAIGAVVELHKPNQDYPEYCDVCWWEEHERETYPCQTIQAIEKELA